MLKLPGIDRLGLFELVSDHQQTLYKLDEDRNRRPRRADRVVLWGCPIGVAALSFLLGWQLQSVGPLLNGIAILTGGLFGLLVMIFGLQSLSTARPGTKRATAALVAETRANVAYATALSLLLVTALMLTDAFSEPSRDGYSPLATAIVLALLLHLGLVLLMVLNRIRLAYSRL
ncbi:hypothetical protein FE697_015345 [Mumia zhuanghuii]|uniref:DUF2178 domain-containing protein n=2 Tax=Mumia TaxID=1546255 RepID=A0ABW1QTG0_9ACTN|nr:MULTISPECIES: hypothetical protein [Mumia]KAA1422507.1 hypothetical protein FE697_015345 [Mumia zhuanghuii]